MLEGDAAGQAALKIMLQLGHDYLPGMAGAYWLDLYKNAKKKERTKQPVWAQAFTKPVAGVGVDVNNSRYYK